MLDLGTFRKLVKLVNCIQLFRDKWTGAVNCVPGDACTLQIIKCGVFSSTSSAARSARTVTWQLGEVNNKVYNGFGESVSSTNNHSE